MYIDRRPVLFGEVEREEILSTLRMHFPNVFGFDAPPNTIKNFFSQKRELILLSEGERHLNDLIRVKCFLGPITAPREAGYIRLFSFTKNNRYGLQTAFEISGEKKEFFLSWEGGGYVLDEFYGNLVDSGTDFGVTEDGGFFRVRRMGARGSKYELPMEQVPLEIPPADQGKLLSQIQEFNPVKIVSFEVDQVSIRVVYKGYPGEGGEGSIVVPRRVEVVGFI